MFTFPDGRDLEIKNASGGGIETYHLLTPTIDSGYLVDPNSVV